MHIKREDGVEILYLHFFLTLHDFIFNLLQRGFRLILWSDNLFLENEYD